MNKMESLVTQMIDEAKKDKRKLISLKNMAVKGMQFELAAELRGMEKELFPESPEEKKAKEISLLFRMVELNVSDDVCWIIYQAIKMHDKMKGKFSIKEACELIEKRKSIFNIEQ